METIGKLTTWSNKAHEAACQLLAQYDGQGELLDKMRVSAQYLRELDRYGSTYADLVELVALGIDLAHEQPICPSFGKSTVKVMRECHIAPKAAPRKRGKK